jgi:hypothetical protein
MIYSSASVVTLSRSTNVPMSGHNKWEPLWEDIERLAEACLAAENHVARRSHFLGAIVLNVAKIVGNSVARSEIIDGQQRLTTLQVFLAALRDCAAEMNSAHAGKLARLTVNQDERPGSDGSFKVWPQIPIGRFSAK